MDISSTLNRSCHCISVDNQALQLELEQRFAPQLGPLDERYEHLFSQSPVFLGDRELERMANVVSACHRLFSFPSYVEWVEQWAPTIASVDHAMAGVFGSFDFHLTEEGPKLIEINTNAGGVLLNRHLHAAQRACCTEVQQLLTAGGVASDLEEHIVQMFRDEWRAFCRSGSASCSDSASAESSTIQDRNLETIAIVDQDPASQFLYPEFVLFLNLFCEAGIHCVIADPGEMQIDDGRLRVDGHAIDLVYNRSTDFYLDSSSHRVLRQALETGLAAVTPAPVHYARTADKRILGLLSSPEQLLELGLEEHDVASLESTVPGTVLLDRENAESLWQRRKQLFFKPCHSHGSRGVYDGAKISRKKFDSIVAGNYVAQERVPPSQRVLMVEGEEKSLKVDFRCIVYRGEVQQVSARLYRGQATNLRTVGGGLSTVFTSPSPQACPKP